MSDVTRFLEAADRAGEFVLVAGRNVTAESAEAVGRSAIERNLGQTGEQHRDSPRVGRQAEV